MDPTDTRTLEQELSGSRSWSQLAGVYECRISALPKHQPERGELLPRLADLLSERLDAPETARRHYLALVRADPGHARGLAGLRRLHTRLGELTAALQISELEERLELPAQDRARILDEAGELWPAVGDEGEARSRFEEAHRLDRGSDASLAGLAGLAEDSGNIEAAATLHEQRLDGLSGQDRSALMERLANLLPATAANRARTLLREVARENPERTPAIQRLLEIARTCSQVLVALGAAPGTAPGNGELLVRSGASESGAVRAAVQLLRALEDSQSLPHPNRAQNNAPDPTGPIRLELVKLVGRSWDLADDPLESLWKQPVNDSLCAATQISRRSMRRLRRAVQLVGVDSLPSLDPKVWREELLAEAAAHAVSSAELSLHQALLACWPATRELNVNSGGNIGAVVQLCAPARALLLRVADETIGELHI